MLVVTETRDKRVYIRMSDTDAFKPRIISTYYLTTADPEVIPTETRLNKHGEVYTARLYGKEIPVYLESPLPAFTEFVPMKKPRGRYVWSWGEWKKI